MLREVQICRSALAYALPIRQSVSVTRWPLSPVLAAMFTALALSVPLPFDGPGRGSGLQAFVGLVATPVLLIVVAALLVWRYGWSQRLLLGAFAGTVGAQLFWTVVAWARGRSDLPPILPFAAMVVLFGLVEMFVCWLVGGAIGTSLQRLRPITPVPRSGIRSRSRLRLGWVMTGTTVLTCIAIVVAYFPFSGSTTSVSCTVRPPTIVPLAGSPPVPKNWREMTPAQLHAAGWRITTSTTVCQTSH
jgi:hypothetical protein